MQRNVVSILLASSMVLVTPGCGDSDKTAGAMKEPATPAAAPAAPPKAMMEKVEPSTSSMMETAKEAVAEATDSMNEAGSAAMDEASSLIDKVKEYLANKDFDMAGQTLEKLSAMKSSLPESMQGQIDSLQAMLSAQEAATSAPSMDAVKDKMPGMAQ